VDLRIGAKLGRGPVGACYAGQLAGAPVIVKVLTSRFHEQPQLLAEVLADARAWLGFAHPNVAKIVEIGEHEARQVVVYEPAPGKTIDRLLKEQGPFEARMAMRVVRDLAVVLAAAHASGRALGDVRAAKTFWDGNKATVADLGLARASCLASGFGRFGMHFGHPDALAPEVLARGLARPTPGTDVYALGCLLFELLNGMPPYRGEVPSVLQEHATVPLPSAPAILASPTLAAFLARMTAKAPEERFPDGQAVLLGIYELVGRPAPVPEPSRMPTGRWQRVSADEVARPEGWSADKVDQATPIGPASLAAEKTTTALRLPSGLGSLPLNTTIDEVTAPPRPASKVTKVTPPAGVPKTATPTAGVPTPAPAAAPAAPGEPGEPEKKPVALKLGKRLGEGACGTSYLSELKDHPAPVAVKVISQRFAKYPELLERILKSLRAAEGFVDPHVVGIIRVAHVGGRDVVIAEHVAGGTLREILKEGGPLPAPAVLDLLKDIGLALQVGRGRDLSHGDVRPDKIYAAEGGYRLADFGFAEASGLGAGFGQFGVPWGHPNYLAPEVIQDPKKPPTFQADVYALGITAYELLAGVPPFVAATPREVLKLHLEAPLPPTPRDARVPAPLAELLLRLTAKDPKRRPAAPLELLQNIERVKKQSDLKATATFEAPPVDEFDPNSSGDEGKAVKDVVLPGEAKRKALKQTKSIKVQTDKPAGPPGWSEAPPNVMNSDDELPPARPR